MSETLNTFASGLASWLKSPLLAVPIGALALTQLYTLGVLPAIQGTLQTQIDTQKSITARSVAAVADLRQKAEADVKIATAHINTQIARYAVRRTTAEADKMAAEAANKQSIAANSPQLQKALRDIVEQEAAIKAEQAVQEQRKAQAVARKTEALARQAATKTRIAEATSLDAATIVQAESIRTCLSNTVVGGAVNRSDTTDARACIQKFLPPPTPARTPDGKVNPAAPGKCGNDYVGWAEKTRPHTAYAYGGTICAHSAAGLATIEQARRDALEACGKWARGCRIYSEK